MIEFAHPQAFLLLLLLPALWWWWSRRGRRPVIKFSGLDAVREAGGRARWRHVLPALRTIALACLIVAAARPQKADVSKQIYAEGIAIQMVLDVSSSMLDPDMSEVGQPPVTRLDVVKDVVQRFVAGDDDALPGRPNDLIGLIRFALYPDSVCPLTLDHDTVLDVVADTEAVQIREESRTAIGDALALAVARMKDLKRTTGAGEQLKINSRVIVLLTDGEDNASEIPPEQAGDLAATFGIKVYTIMAGTGARVGFSRMPVDDSPLRHIAEITGGQHFTARTPGALAKVYEEIDRLERTKTEEKRFVLRDERAQPWLLAAFAALVLQTLLASTRLRKIP